MTHNIFIVYSHDLSIKLLSDCDNMCVCVCVCMRISVWGGGCVRAYVLVYMCVRVSSSLYFVYKIMISIKMAS